MKRAMLLGLLGLLELTTAGDARAAGEFKAHNFILPGGAVKVDEDRFRLPQPWEDAVKFYRLAFPPAKYPRRTLHSQSGVRAMHIVNPHPARNEDDWEGVNLYEFGRGEVRVFVLAHPPSETPPDAGRKPAKKA